MAGFAQEAEGVMYAVFRLQNRCFLWDCNNKAQKKAANEHKLKGRFCIKASYYLGFSESTVRTNN
jgi:hypothetical protein